MNVEVNTPKGWETIENAVGFRIVEENNLFIWGDPPEGKEGWTDLAFYRDGWWLSAQRQETP